MDTKQKLLLFLYENRHSSYHLEINHIFKDCGLRPIDIQALIGDLKRNNIIETDSKYTRLGCDSRSLSDRSLIHYTVDNVVLKAKLVLKTGEQYVRDNYFPQNTIPAINATQVVYANGDINAPISQANDYSDSSSSIDKQTIKPIVHPPKAFLRTLMSHKTLAGIIITIIGGLILYFITNYLSN